MTVNSTNKLSNSSTNQTVQTSQSFDIHSMADDLLRKTFSYNSFTLSDICNFRLVCKRWKKNASHYTNTIGKRILKTIGRIPKNNESWFITYKYWLDNTKHIILLDQSASMATCIHNFGGQTRWEYAKDKICNLFQKLLPISKGIDLYLFECQFKMIHIKCQKELMDFLKDQQSSGGYTNLENVLDEVFYRHFHQETKSSRIYMLTDGVPDSVDRVVTKIKNTLQKAEENNSEIMIKIFQVGKDKNAYKFLDLFKKEERNEIANCYVEVLPIEGLKGTDGDGPAVLE